MVDGVECDHLAFRNLETDWQIWIERGERPLPRKYVITSKTVATAPQYTLRLRDWLRSLVPAREEEPLPLVDVDLPVPREPDPVAVALLAEVEGIEPRERTPDQTALALAGAGEGDTVLLAGKGHETTQTIGDRVLPFDDREVARELVAEGVGR